MKLYINNVEAVKGQEVLDFRGDKHILIGWAEPRHQGSTGRIHVKSPGAKDQDMREYYPGVINAEFRE